MTTALLVTTLLFAQPSGHDQDTCRVANHRFDLSVEPLSGSPQGPEDFRLYIVDGAARVLVVPAEGRPERGWLLSPGWPSQTCSTADALAVDGRILFFVGEWGGEPDDFLDVILYEPSSRKVLDHRTLSRPGGSVLVRDAKGLVYVAGARVGGGAGPPGRAEALPGGDVVTPAYRTGVPLVIRVSADATRIIATVDVERTFASTGGANWRDWFADSASFAKAFGLGSSLPPADKPYSYWGGTNGAGRKCISPRPLGQSTGPWYCRKDD